VWNFNTADMPREPGTRLWIAHPTDGKVYLTYRTHGTKRHPEGWWSGWMPGVEPVAWMLFVKPAHPFADRTIKSVDDARENMLATIHRPAVPTASERYAALDAAARSDLSAIMGTVPGAEFLIDDVGGM
jgi:hypothetical protein